MVTLRLVRSDREGEGGTGRAAEIETQVGRQALGGAEAESGLRLPAQLCPLVMGGRRCCHHCHMRLWGSVPTSLHAPPEGTKGPSPKPFGLQPAMNTESLLVPGTYTQEQAFPFPNCKLGSLKGLRSCEVNVLCPFHPMKSPFPWSGDFGGRWKRPSTVFSALQEFWQGT